MTGTSLGKFYEITPVPKPRMTRSDKWKKRKCVLKYWAFKDAVRAAGIKIPHKCSVVFYIAMPESWSRPKYCEMVGKPHQQKPDLDNLIKALCDAALDKDEVIWSVEAQKLWAYSAGIEIRAVI